MYVVSDHQRISTGQPNIGWRWQLRMAKENMDRDMGKTSTDFWLLFILLLFGTIQ